MKTKQDKVIQQIYKYLRELESGKISPVKGHGDGTHASGHHRIGSHHKGNKKKGARPTREIKKLAKRFQAYRNLTGRIRLKGPEKEALKEFTAKQVYKANTHKNIEALTEKRFENFWKLYGENFTDKDIDEIKYQLRYLTSTQLAKKWDLKDGPEPPKKIPIRFTDVSTPSVSWDSLPNNVKNWSHKSGNFLYENHVWNISDGNVVKQLLIYAAKGKDHTLKEFLENVVPVFNPNLAILGDDYECILVDLDEYNLFERYKSEGRAELSEDFKKDRLYYLLEDDISEDDRQQYLDEVYQASKLNRRNQFMRDNGLDDLLE